MATGTRSDFTLIQPAYQTAQVEELAKNLNVFNAASRNALVLLDRRIASDYETNIMFDLVDLIQERDPTSTSGVSDTGLTDTTSVGIKKYMRIGPSAMTLDAWLQKGMTSANYSTILGAMSATKKQENILSLAAAALAAKLSNTPGNYIDISVDSTPVTLTPDALARALALFGDQATNIVCWLMHSKPYFDLVRNAIGASTALYGEGNVVVFGGSPGTLGRPVVLTDAALYEDTSPNDTYYTLGLVQSAMVCEQSEPDNIASETVLGTQNLSYRIQGEYAINYTMKGCKWDVTNGGTNPSAAAMGTYTNWDSSFATNAKLLPGVCIISN